MKYLLATHGLETALQQGVSFGIRGNLLLVAPPLVIDEGDLDRAIGLLDALLARHFSASAQVA